MSTGSTNKKLKQDDTFMQKLVNHGVNRKFALGICAEQQNNVTLACGMWSHARSALQIKHDDGLSPILKDQDSSSVSQGLFALVRSGWRPDRFDLADDVVSFCRKVLESEESKYDTRWYCAHVLAVTLNLSKEVYSSLQAKFGLVPWYQQPTSWSERWQRLVASEPQEGVDGQFGVSYRENADDLADIHGILCMRRKHSQSPSEEFFELEKRATEHPTTSQKNLRTIATALYTSPEHSPIILRGGPGCGKSWSIRTLAALCGQELIELQLDDQVDSKTLLGSMTCVRGTFAWLPGAMTRAIHEGTWVLIEDIDSAPAEVLSSLKPLFETGQLTLPNRSSSLNLKASPGFRLFGTTTKSKSSRDYQPHWSWTVIDIEPLNRDELVQVCATRFARIPRHIIESIVTQHFTVHDKASEGAETLSPAQMIRDLFKWLTRVNTFCALPDNLNIAGFISEKQKTGLILEGVDVITSRMADPNSRISFARTLATHWGLSPDVGNDLIQSRSPDFTFDANAASWTAGRVRLQFPRASIPKEFQDTFAPTSVALRTLEQISVCVSLNEPCLLVGETGAGKTSVIQLLAKCCGKNLIVQNMHVQSDSTEFLGGFKPAPSLRADASKLHAVFMALFDASFDAKENEKFLDAVVSYCEGGKWKKLIKALETACAKYASTTSDPSSSSSSKSKRPRLELDESWKLLYHQVEAFKAKTVQGNDLFTFVEGVLVKALRNGDWILLDEINLASSETLERLLPLLESPEASLSLTERGDTTAIPRHPEFRLFAAMNPSTDFGKKNLPPAVRARFTEIHVDEIKQEPDIRLIVERFLAQDARDLVEPTVEMFVQARMMASTVLVDGNGQAPRYSLRTLVRTLHSARTLVTSQRFGMKRALFEAFSALFATVLEPKSFIMLQQEIAKKILGGADKIPTSNTSKIDKASKEKKILVCSDSYWIDRGAEELDSDDKFVITPHVESRMKLLARAIALKRYPILLQGPTSAGKTSLIAHLAKLTGNKFVRINNHEHTDLEEYLGSYVADDQGKLVFHYGALVEAVRNGYWIVLDELNLAPSDVLEALNRLLDDNRELFLTETQETIVPHPNFILFATQNPPGGAYGGRKQLSRAFRNRFLELHLDDIPHNELETILEKRNRLPSAFSRAMVAVMRDLQMVRSKSHLFAGKAGLITPRDLMRWADRDPRTYQELAEQGFRLLGERLRSEEEMGEVQRVIEKYCRSAIDFDVMYQVPEEVRARDAGIVWTKSMRRLFSLVYACAANREPCLIVGETGLGKTRCVQAVACAFETELVVLNCHQGTETADILGSLRPLRSRGEINAKLKALQTEHGFESIQALLDNSPDAIKDEVAALIGKSMKLFEWADGPLVSCMRSGEFFLLDEISLAEDAVLERLNSVLEPGRTLTLAERGGKVVEVLQAHERFRGFATMNPGGDFGKRELSPALRNRFTEIWLPAVTDVEDLRAIVSQVFTRRRGGGGVVVDGLDHVGLTEQIVQFAKWFNEKVKHKHQNFAPLSMRDVIAWAEFIIEALKRSLSMSTEQQLEMFAHGCFLTCLDGLGVGAGFGNAESKRQFLDDCRADFPGLFAFEDKSRDVGNVIDDLTKFGIAPFTISKETNETSASQSQLPFEFNAPTTRLNLVRLLRAMQLPRAILLEGSPGVGKTSIVSALARAVNKRLVRVNLSEQTDFSDLVGSDLPVPSSSSSAKMEFRWSDGVFLQALRNGDWVLLDELNLASQSVLEGLNAVLDHRASVFVPELNRSFPCHKDFRVFACQNPLQQGGGRKGLPKSFLNRFTKVFVEALDSEDYNQIASKVFPTCSHLSEVVNVVDRMRQSFGNSSVSGEFNLRDIFRFCGLMERMYPDQPRVVFDLLLASRMGVDLEKCDAIFNECFPSSATTKFDPYRVYLSDSDEQMICFGSKECVLRRISGENDAEDETTSSMFPSSLTPMLIRCAQCVHETMPVLLVGESQSGKTLIVKRLSALLGRKLNVFQMTSGTDSTELLGCFEQIDFQQSRMDLFQNVLKLLSGEIAACHEDLERVQQLHRIKSLGGLMAQDLLAGGSAYATAEMDALCDTAIALLSNSQSIEAIRSQLAAIRSRSGEDLQQQQGFKWIDGALLQAMEKGEWIVLEDANVCSPTVLDRLNSLLEINGELVVNEQGTTLGGGLRVCKPHKDFRIFLTVNSSLGLVSRAMRNRCVELFLSSDAYRPSERDRMLFLEEEKGIRAELVQATDPVVVRARELRIRAEMGEMRLDSVYVKNWPRPFPVGFGQSDLARDSFVANVRFPWKLQEELKAMDDSILRERLMQFLRGDDAVEKPVLAKFITLCQRLRDHELAFLSTASATSTTSTSIQSQLRTSLLNPRHSKLKLKHELERIVVDIKTKVVSGDKSVRFLKETFDSMTEWLLLQNDNNDDDADLLDARDDFWRLAIASDSPAMEEINLVWRRMIYRVARRISSIKSNNNNNDAKWVHFENVAKRFDATLKLPCLKDVLADPHASEMDVLTVYDVEPHPRPPTDLVAFQGLVTLLGLSNQEYESIINEDEQTSSVRGENFRRGLVSALCTLRFAGSGGGIGSDKSMSKSVSELRDAAIIVVATSSSNNDFVDPLIVQTSASVRPLAERILALKDVKINQLLGQLASSVVEETTSSISNAFLERLQSECRLALEFALKTNSKPCDSVAMYQELLWSSEKTSAFEFRDIARALLSEALVHSNAMRWEGNALNNTTENWGRKWISCDSPVFQNTLAMFVNSLIRGSGIGVDLGMSKPEMAKTISVVKPVALNEREAKITQLETARLCLRSFSTGFGAMDSDLTLLGVIRDETVRTVHHQPSLLTNTAELDLLQDCLSKLDEVMKHLSNNPLDLGRLGTAHTTLGVCRSVLSTPKSKLDPQSKPRVLVNLLRRRKAVLDLELLALEENRHWTFGGSRASFDVDEDIARTRTKLQSVMGQIAELESRGIAIPRETEFEQLVEEIQVFTTTVGEPQRVLALAKLSSSKNQQQDVQSFLQLCGSFCSRLCKQYASCCDVVMPFVASLYMVMHGLNCLQMNRFKKNNSDAGKMETLVKNLIAWPRCDNTNNQDLEHNDDGELKGIPTSLGPKFNTKLVLASLPSFELVKTESSNGALSRKDHDQLAGSFARLTTQWQIDKAEEERLRREREATVKVKKHRTEQETEDEEAELLRRKEEDEMRSMFPDFHKDFALQDEPDEFGESVYPDPDQSQPTTTDAVQALNPDQVETFVESFISLYASATNDSKQPQQLSSLRTQLFAASLDAASDLVSQVAFYGDPEIDSALLASQLFAVNSCLSDLRL